MAKKKRRHGGLRGLSGSPSDHERDAKIALEAAEAQILEAQKAKTCRGRVLAASNALADARQLMLSAEYGPESMRSRLQSRGISLGAKINKLLYDSGCIKAGAPPR